MDFENIEGSEVVNSKSWVGNIDFIPCAFDIGNQKNPSGENIKSLKILAYASMMKYNKTQTLKLFGEYYQEVLGNPDGDDHQNIRALENSKNGMASFKIHGEVFPLKLTICFIKDINL